MNFEKFTIKAQQALSDSQQLVLNHNQQQLEPEHLLKALLEDSESIIPSLLKKIDVDILDLNRQLTLVIEKKPRVSGQPTPVYASENFNQLLNQSLIEARDLRDEYVSTEHLLLALLTVKISEVFRILSSFGVTKDKILLALKDLRGSQRVTDQNPEGKYRALE